VYPRQLNGIAGVRMFEAKTVGLFVVTAFPTYPRRRSPSALLRGHAALPQAGSPSAPPRPEPRAGREAPPRLDREANGTVFELFKLVEHASPRLRLSNRTLPILRDPVGNEDIKLMGSLGVAGGGEDQFLAILGEHR